LPLDDIKVCIHVDADRCSCRKPNPGMLLDAARERDISFEQSIMIGDRWRDIEAGQAVGCLTILVDGGGYQEKPCTPDRIVRSLPEAVTYIECGHTAGEG
jgi:D-glycero-D-manno-heptose 1,7-bisphosphate phosphatase